MNLRTIKNRLMHSTTMVEGDAGADTSGAGAAAAEPGGGIITGDGAAGSDSGSGGDAPAAASGEGAGNPASGSGDGKDAAAEGADGGGDKSLEPAAGAPEKYEFALPEGMTLDEAALGKFEPVMRELGLTQENAQKLVTQYADLVKGQAEANVAATLAAATEVRTNWAKETIADPDVGGGSPEKLAQNRAVMAAALDKFGGPELRTLLNETGLTNNVHLARFFMKVGAELGEAPVHLGDGGGKLPTSREARMYDPAFLPENQRR